MAWPVPKTHADWIGYSWARPAVINAMLDAAAMRATAVSEAAGGGTVAADHIVVGADLQSVDQWNALRPRDTVPSGSHALILAGAYGINQAGTAAATIGGSARWVDPDGIEEGGDWTEGANQLWTSAGGFTSKFLGLVNDQLTAWGLDPMGSSLINHGAGEADIPWTRKYGSAAAPTTAYGPMQAGDIIGEWILNEWRAVLQVLRAIAKTPTWTTPDTWLYWEGNGGSASCAGAKSDTQAIWEDARARAVSPVTSPPANVAATGAMDWEPGEGVFGHMTRAWIEYAITNCGTLSDGDWLVFIKANAWRDAFEDFDDAGWADGEIGQVETTPGGAFTFSPAPFKDPSTDDEEIQRVPCPVEDEVERDSTGIGYELDAAPQMVAVFDFPDP